MTATRKYEALIVATADELAAAAAIVGDRNVKRLVMADNGVPAFYQEGPAILEQYAAALSEAERAHLKTWEELDEDTQDKVVGYAAGCAEWIDNPPWLDSRYIADTLADDPELKDALLHP